MGKYSKLDLPAFRPEPSYQEKLDARKVTLKIAGMPPGELGLLFKTKDLEIDKLEMQLKDLKMDREVMSQELLVAMEDDDLSSFKLTDGTLIYQQEEPYATVKDKFAWLAWIKKTKQTELLSVLWQTMNGIVKKALTDGEPVPPGIEVFMKSSVRMRKGKE